VTALLEATQLSVRHPGAAHDSLHDLQLSVMRGEVLCLSGARGSGKSTTLAALARTVRPREGDVTMAGTPIWAMAPDAFTRKVAHLPQDPSFANATTVEELVGSGRVPHPCDQQAIDEAIANLELQHVRTRPMESLSAGERRRAWLAMVLCRRAEVLLLDDPLASLDLRHRWELLGHLARLNREWGVTMVIVLPELELAAALAHRIAILTRGRLYEIAHPARLLRGEMLLDVFGEHCVLQPDAHLVTDALRDAGLHRDQA